MHRLLSLKHVIVIVDPQEHGNHLQVVSIDHRKTLCGILNLVELHLFALTKLHVIIDKLCLIFLYKDISSY